jgi:hypothetical protein
MEVKLKTMQPFREIRRLPKPNDNLFCVSIDLSHHVNLLAAFGNIGLVDADCIYPPQLTRASRNLSKCIVKVDADTELLAIA